MGCICQKEKKINNINNENNFIDEILIKGKAENNKVDFDTVDKVRKSICKIIIYENDEIKFATGFFILYLEMKFLITCNHVISLDVKKFEIEIWNKQIKLLELKDRNLISFEKPIDVTVIEINDLDDFINDIQFLDYDLNYIKGYSQYKNIEVFSLGYPNGEKLKSDNGIIEEINEPEFFHNINTQTGSSGSPIILFTTLKVIGVHKQGDKKKNLNVGIFFGEILNKIGKPKIMIKDYINEYYKIDIDIIDEFKCIIYYKSSITIFSDLGFLIKMPIGQKRILTGLLTKYHVEEKKLNTINTINIYKNKQLLDKLDSKDRFNFSDDFPNVTFIEIKNQNFDYIKIFEGKHFSENIILINYSPSLNSINQTFGKFKEKWGTSIRYLSDINKKSTYINSGLLIDNQLIGIHKKNYNKNNMAININIISKAIKLNYLEKINNDLDKLNKEKDSKLLIESHVYDLMKKGLVLTDIPNLFVSPASFGVTPIWFLRTKHGWYWTPTKPDKNDFDLSNWMIIIPKNSLEVIGGFWDGIEPAQRNIDLIRWLEKSKLTYCD